MTQLGIARVSQEEASGSRLELPTMSWAWGRLVVALRLAIDRWSNIRGDLNLESGLFPTATSKHSGVICSPVLRSSDPFEVGLLSRTSPMVQQRTKLEQESSNFMATWKT